MKSNDRKKLFQKIAAVFGVTHDYSNKDVELEFTFSGENLKESLTKQGKHYYSFMKMLSCFDSVVENAIGIETHNRNAEGYKEDPSLQNVYVLAGAFQDENDIVPVKLEVKEFSDKNNALYVAIALGSFSESNLAIKKSSIDTLGNTGNGVTQDAPLLTVKLTDLIATVNPQDTAFLKYVPAEMLTSDQASAMMSYYQQEINKASNEMRQLKESPAYREAIAQLKNAKDHAGRVEASQNLKKVKQQIGLDAIDQRISSLNDSIQEIRDAQNAKHRADQEKYSGTKTKGYALEADTRLKELDEAYTEAVESGDKKQMQKLVDQAAEAAMAESAVRGKNGKLLKVYHYTNSKKFTVFDRSRARTGNEMDGFFFAPDSKSTREYGKNRVTAYLNITNLAYDPVLDRRYDDSGTLLREKLAYEGYDGVARTENGEIYEYMAFDSNQVKSADPVTYDDEGNVIPLSERFNSKEEDIRYSSRKPNPEAYDAEEWGDGRYMPTGWDEDTNILQPNAAENYRNSEGQKNNAQEGVMYSERYAEAPRNQKLLDMIQSVKSGDSRANDKVYLGTVPQKNAAEIRRITGINVDGFRIAIEARQMEHILKRHGAEGIADHSMANASDIARMEYAMSDPEHISPAGKTQAYTYMRNGRNHTADTIRYEKAIGERTYYVIQAVPDSKAKTLYIVSAFIQKNKGASQLIDANSPNVNAQSGSVVTPNKRVTQAEPDVNGEVLKSSRERLDREYLAAVERGDMETAQRMVTEYAWESGAMDFDNGMVRKYFHRPNASFMSFNYEKTKKRNSSPEDTSKRACKLVGIGIGNLGAKGSNLKNSSSSPVTNQVANAGTVADLFLIVNQTDKFFMPKSASKAVNEDGMQKELAALNAPRAALKTLPVM